VKVSIVVPSKGCKYLSYLLASLKNQSIKSFEVILIVKDCSIKYVKNSAKNILWYALLLSRRKVDIMLRRPGYE